MNAVTRWKTIATIAVAFSAGNLFATACQDAGGGKAQAEDEAGTTEDSGTDAPPPPPEVTEADLAEVTDALSATQADIEAIRCVLQYLEDDDQDGEIGEGSNLRDYDLVAANAACGL